MPVCLAEIYTPEEAVRLIETHHGPWIAYKAHVTVEASVSRDKKAVCDGDIAYERLQEKMMLLCVGDQGNVLFIFKAEDRNFEFYQPAAQTLFYGSIFDLEDDPQIETQIKPLDIYRSLKLSAIAPDKARIEKREPGFIHLSVRSSSRKKTYQKRLLTLTQYGEVPLEIYYTPEGAMDVTIYRLNYQAYKAEGLTGREKYAFPTTIKILSPEDPKTLEQRKTVLRFQSFDFKPEMTQSSWALPVPPETKRINISENFKKLEARMEPVQQTPAVSAPSEPETGKEEE